MLNTPGEQDDDELLDLAFDGLDVDGPDPGDDTSGDDELDDCPPLDDDREQVGYELFDWSATDLDLLDDELHEVQIPHEWVSDGMEVVVHADDEAAVDALLGRVRYPDELPIEDDDDGGTAEVLGSLFVASDRIARNPVSSGVASLLETAEGMDETPPFGVDETLWEVVTERVDELIDALHAGADPEVVQEHAARLRDGLAPFV